MRVIRDATLADGRHVDVRLDGDTIDAVGRRLQGDDYLDAAGNLLLPGVIDAHVHFREPGFDHKETWKTGSKSAAAGGVTTVVDQPNTSPPTTDGAAFDEKAGFAEQSIVDWGINGGVTPEWDPDSLFERPLFALGEVFLADSTGDMGIEADLFADALERAADEDVVVTVHAEDAERFDKSVLPRSTKNASSAEPRSANHSSGRNPREDGDEPRASARERDDADAWSAFRAAEAEEAAVRRAVEVAMESDATVHIAHTSTPEGVDAARVGAATCEVTPHHLFLSRDHLDDLGTWGRMNPPLRSEARRQAMVERLVDGRIDIVATDHAPHTREEKDVSIWDAPSGVPGVETSLPLLLAAARDGPLTYERVRDATSRNVARIFDLPRKGRIAPGYDADLALVDPDAVEPISADSLHSKCDWTPFEGFDGVFPEWTMVRGTRVYDRDADEFADHEGRNVRAR